MILGKDADAGQGAVANVRRLFLSPAPAYRVADAAALLGIDWREMRGWIEVGELEGVDTAEGLLIPWAELVSFAMDFWSQEVVEDALGADVASAIPELLRLTALEVRIPRMEVVVLERLAARDGKSVDGVLAAELRDLVSAHSEWLMREVAGFAEALAWPETAAV